MSAWINKCHFGDCIETMRRMPAGIVQTCVTSPPYFGLRDYGHDGQIGLEATPDQFIAKLVDVFREVKRVLRDDGTLWLNIGDSYASNPASGGQQSSSMTGGEHKRTPKETKYKRPDGMKPKDLIGIPWMLAFALRADGWYLRQEIIWSKPNPMPESVTDRCTKSHESIFLLAKSERYYFDASAISEPSTYPDDNRKARAKQETYNGMTGEGGQAYSAINPAGAKTYPERNKRSVWTVATTPYSGAHFATFPTKLIEPCILAGAPAGGVVLDPFGGSGTTAQVAQALGRKWILCELNEAYGPLIAERVSQPSFEFTETS